jgi:hypothetical protein
MNLLKEIAMKLTFQADLQQARLVTNLPLGSDPAHPLTFERGRVWVQSKQNI